MSPLLLGLFFTSVEDQLDVCFPTVYLHSLYIHADRQHNSLKALELKPPL